MSSGNLALLTKRTQRDQILPECPSGLKAYLIGVGWGREFWALRVLRLPLKQGHSVPDFAGQVMRFGERGMPAVCQNQTDSRSLWEECLGSGRHTFRP